MIDLTEHREKVVAAVQRKQERATKPEEPDTHVHVWHDHLETVHPARSTANEIKGYYYAQGRAYFIVKVCYGCKKKRRINLTVEA